jgi:hypothetical protein
LLVVDAPDDAVVPRPPPPVESIADVASAVTDALRFPLAGEPLEALAPRGGRATLVIEPPSLPLPGATDDPRRDALAATAAELTRAGVPLERQTLLVAGGLSRRAGQRELEMLVSPGFARRFRGHVEVHDAERPDLVDLGSVGRVPLRVHPSLTDADVVVTITAAETVLHGGPAALVGAAGTEALRAAGAYSLLETAGSQGWRIGLGLEQALAALVPVVGVSLTLNNPVLTGALSGYPHEPEALDRIAAFPFRRLFGRLPGPARRRLLHWLPRELTAFAAFAGPPSVAHAEALLRGVESRAATLEEPLEAVCIGVPHASAHVPREAPNPLIAAWLALGFALRLWRDRFPVAEGGTAILVHRFQRRFAHPTQAPYRALFQALRASGAPDPEHIADGERAAGSDDRALRAYRQGRSCHPILPFVDWAACGPALGRLGAVLVAGCRDAAAARMLGFIPTHGLPAALAMTRGRAGGEPRIGFLPAPPYFPIRVRTP